MRRLIWLFGVFFIIACKESATPKKQIIADNCSQKGDACYVTSSNGLNLRDKPNSKGRILTVLPYGQFVEIEEVSPDEAAIGQFKGHFVRVTYLKKTGWVLDSLLSTSKPISNDYEIASKTIERDLKEIEKLGNDEEKLNGLKVLRKKISDSEHNVGLRFLDYDACMQELNIRHCQGKNEALFAGTEKEFVKAVTKAIGEKDSIFLNKYTSCLVEVGCWFCDVFINTPKENAIASLLSSKKPISFAKVQVDTGKDREQNAANVYIYADPSSTEQSLANFVLKINKLKGKYQIGMLGGDVMRNITRPTCAVGG